MEDRGGPEEVTCDAVHGGVRTYECEDKEGSGEDAGWVGGGMNRANWWVWVEQRTYDKPGIMGYSCTSGRAPVDVTLW